MHTSVRIRYYNVMEYDSNGDFIKRTLYDTSGQTAGDTITHTVGENTAFIRWGSNPTIVAITYDEVADIDWMLTKGSTAQEFVPYGKIISVGTPETITASSGGTASVTDLLAVGDYTDTQDIVSGAVERQTEAILYDGAQTIREPYISSSSGLDAGSIIVKPRTTMYRGASVTITTERDTPLTALVAEFNPIQNLHGYTKPWQPGGAKNLVDVADVTGITSQTQIGDVTLSAGDYTISAYISNSGNSGAGVMIAKPDNTSIKSIGFSSSATVSRYSGSFTLTEETNCKIFVVGTAAGYNVSVSDVQVEAGSTLTDYVPYSNVCPISGHDSVTLTVNGEDKVVNLPAAAGTVYGGTVDVVNGVLTVDRAIVDLGDLTWILLQAGSNYIWGTPSMTSSDVDVVPICTHYEGESKANNNSGAYNNGNGTCCFIKDGVITGSRFYVRDDAHLEDTAEEFKTAMSGVKVVYGLTTPLIYQFTPIQLQTIPGSNSISADTGDVEVYILSPITESVDAQELNLVTGDNTISVFSEISDINLIATYRKAR